MTDIVTYCDINTCEDCPRYGDDCDGDKRVEHTDYISRADAVEAVCSACCDDGKKYEKCTIYRRGLCADLEALEALPSADAVEVKADQLPPKVPTEWINDGMVLVPQHDWIEMQKELEGYVSADAVQGEWQTDKDKELMRCSVCGTFFNKHTEFFDFEVFAKYCPYCGARMTPYKGGDSE